MKSKTYIIAWNEAIVNCIDISQQLYGKVEHTFFNVSSTDNLNENWQRTDDVRYYRHFFNAINDFLQTDADIFIFSAGDAKYENHVEYIKYMERIFSENPNLVAFAPNATHDFWVGKRSSIKPSSKYENLYLVTCINGIHFALDRDTCVILDNFYKWSSVDNKFIEPKEMISGWGIDIMLSAYAIYNNKYCYKDSGVLFSHPATTHYNQTKAKQEQLRLIEEFSKFLEKELSYDISRYQKIVSNISKFATEHRLMTIKDFYPEPEKLSYA